MRRGSCSIFFFFFQAEDGIRDVAVTGVRRVLFRSAVLGPTYAAGPFAAQERFVEQALARAAPLTAVASGPADRPAVQLRILRDDGAQASATTSTLPRTGLLQMSDPAPTTFGIVVAPDPVRYTIEATSPGGGTTDFSVTTPAADPTRSLHLRFGGIVLDPG